MSQQTPTPEPDPTNPMNAVPPNAVPPTALPPAAVPPTAAFPSAGPSQSEFPADPQGVSPHVPSGSYSPSNNPPGHHPPRYIPASVTETSEGWRTAYHKEHKKVRILGLTTAAGAVLALVFGVWGITQMANTPSSVAGVIGGEGQRDGTITGPGMGGPAAAGRPGGGAGQGLAHGQAVAPPEGAIRGGLLENMLNADGTVNQSAVDQFASQMAAGDGPPAALLADMAAREVANGDLTQAQADQILAALGINGTSGSTSGTTPGAASSTTTTT